MSDVGVQSFSGYMRDLWKMRGRPSSRRLASSAGVSHTTVSEVLRGRIPSWSTAELIVKALKGSEDVALQLWEEQGGLPRAAHEPPSLTLPFALVLREWVDEEVALFALARALGFIDGSGFGVFQAHKHIFRSEGEVLGEALQDVLARLVGSTLVERRGDRYRLRPGVPDRAEVEQ
jgi:transcriptional regulator with XRE-family HTH domain